MTTKAKDLPVKTMRGWRKSSETLAACCMHSCKNFLGKPAIDLTFFGMVYSTHKHGYFGDRLHCRVYDIACKVDKSRNYHKNPTTVAKLAEPQSGIASSSCFMPGVRVRVKRPKDEKHSEQTQASLAAYISDRLLVCMS